MAEARLTIFAAGRGATSLAVLSELSRFSVRRDAADVEPEIAAMSPDMCNSLLLMNSGISLIKEGFRAQVKHFDFGGIQ